MNAQVALDRIASADIDVEEARKIARDCLRDDPGLNAMPLYRSFRVWTWKALTARRRDRELRDWFILMQRCQALLSQTQPVAASRISALADLLEDSIRFGEMHPVDILVSRSHVREILLIVSSKEAGVSRRRILEATGLSESSLSQVLSIMVAAGTLERRQVGRSADFSLTSLGNDLVHALKRRDSAGWIGKAAKTSVTLEPSVGLEAVKGFRGLRETSEERLFSLRRRYRGSAEAIVRMNPLETFSAVKYASDDGFGASLPFSKITNSIVVSADNIGEYDLRLTTSSKADFASEFMK